MPRPPQPEEQERIEAHQRRVQVAQRFLPELPIPCFGYLALERQGQTKGYLLGPRTEHSCEPRILDWRTAPLAGIFFAEPEGAALELEVADRPFVGRVVERALYRLEGRRLVELRFERARAFERDGVWWIDEDPAPPVFLERPASARQRPASAWVTELDPAQRAAVERPADRSLLVLGEAGFGKTTVALHRLAHLARAAEAERRPFAALVVVPTEGLLRLTRLTLDRLRAHGLEVATYDQLAVKEAQAAFPDLPARVSEDRGASVLRLKRHPALLGLLEKKARSLGPPKRRVLLRLFGDGELLRQVASEGQLSPHVVAEVLEHTHQQYEPTTERAHRHVDRDRLQALDGRRLDEGTPDELAETFDPEDAAVLFELAYRRGERPENLGRFDHLVLDEAQELAPIELRWLGRLLRPGGAVTIAGDAQQQTDDTAYFLGWAQVARALGVPEVESIELKESYRCPPEVTTYAREVLAGNASWPADQAGAPVLGTITPSACHQAFELIEALKALTDRDRTASVAVIGRHGTAAKQLADELGRGLAVRLALHGAFDFAPGVVVTSLQDVKGLEFDYVVVPDAGPLQYPPTPEGRRALYVALTRASHQVWLSRVAG
ncbi:MAG: AAA family ATPase [Deltaproteobacteria bacterium]|nr:AAA family ATPase [Deltaproteobacteria bacterium]